MQKTVYVDNCTALAQASDPEFCTLLGMKFGWTGYIISFLIRKKGMNTRSALFEDMVTDVVTNLILSLRQGKLREKIESCKALAKDEKELGDKIRPVFTTAIDLRFRGLQRNVTRHFRREHQFPEDFEASSRAEGGVTDVDDLKKMITEELQSRRLTPKVKNVALMILPDRFEGMGLREICEKHGISRGQVANDALNEIKSCGETVLARLREEVCVP